jgi:hypothetical protein
MSQFVNNTGSNNSMLFSSNQIPGSGTSSCGGSCVSYQNGGSGYGFSAEQSIPGFRLPEVKSYLNVGVNSNSNLGASKQYIPDNLPGPISGGRRRKYKGGANDVFYGFTGVDKNMGPFMGSYPPMTLGNNSSINKVGGKRRLRKSRSSRNSRKYSRKSKNSKKMRHSKRRQVRHSRKVNRRNKKNGLSKMRMMQNNMGMGMEMATGMNMNMPTYTKKKSMRSNLFKSLIGGKRKNKSMRHKMRGGNIYNQPLSYGYGLSNNLPHSAMANPIPIERYNSCQPVSRI